MCYIVGGCVIALEVIEMMSSTNPSRQGLCGRSFAGNYKEGCRRLSSTLI